MLNDTRKILVGVLSFIAVLGFTFFLWQVFNNGKDKTSNVIKQFDEVTGNYSNLTYSPYEGRTDVSGGEVVSLIKRLNSSTDGVSIKVITKGNPDGTVYSKTSCAIITDKTNNDYINEYASFTCTLTKNSNGMLTVCTFTQN